jgi:hypothetical protein
MVFFPNRYLYFYESDLHAEYTAKRYLCSEISQIFWKPILLADVANRSTRTVFICPIKTRLYAGFAMMDIAKTYVCRTWNRRQHKNSNPYLTLHTKYYIIISKRKQKFVKYIGTRVNLKKEEETD